MAPPAAVHYASSDRRGENPQKHLAAFAGILQADCYSGFEPLFTRKGKRCRPRRHFASPMRGGASSSWRTSRNRSGRTERQTGLPDRAGGGQAS
ncbi:IS66 family transposase [Bradyrhizobium sp. BR 1433]|uniref:IS66 family transposase n=1 Tax=Bradyrhizobium sp. BR 1433 TaxID=3447967 RepID=UPI003EE6CB60